MNSMAIAANETRLTMSGEWMGCSCGVDTAHTAFHTMAIKDTVTVEFQASLLDRWAELQPKQLVKNDRFMHPAARKFEPCMMHPGICSLFTSRESDA
jgi:hypothetical protein